jgi:hypothetical protein
VPKGQLTEIFGAASSGKTTLALALLAGCTREGGIGAYIDPGGTFFAPAAFAAGVDLRRVIVIRPRDEAGARRAADALVRGGACGVVALDCSEWPHVLQTHHCARLVAQAEKNGTMLLVISGGANAAVASFASLRLRTHGLAPLWQDGSDGGDRLMGCIATIDVAKARSTSPGRSVSFEAKMPDVAGTYPITQDGTDLKVRGYVTLQTQDINPCTHGPSGPCDPTLCTHGPSGPCATTLQVAIV